jgi:DNA-binding response OmpR family regulator
LIVDDEALLTRTLSQAFRDAGFEVSSAGSAEEAAGIYAHNAPFDLLILDNRLPGKSGLDLLGSVDRTERTRVVLMTAYDTVDTHKRSVELGVDLYLKKPFDLESLLRMASELVGNGAGV